VDCDGVLASDRLLWQRMHRRFPEHIPARYEDLKTFEWPRATPETTALCLELSADPQFMSWLRPMPRMITALRRLHEEGYRVHVITARPDCVRRVTARWLRRLGVDDCVEAITCVEGGAAKVPLARELGCAAFIEDNHATAEAMGAAGIRSYLLDAPYNRMPTEHSIRARGWRALINDLTLQVPARQPALHLVPSWAGAAPRDAVLVS
jgi:phosphoglycolate phosphatase-like HAD superfamily hydrolase